MRRNWLHARTEPEGKGYGSEAVQLMVDYLFLIKDIVRIQAETHPKNKASSRVLEKAGFSKEVIICKSFFGPKYGLDISCARLVPYETDHEKIGIVSSILIPLPEGED